MKECREIRELLSAMLDDAVTLEEQQRIAVHLAACARCREVLAELRRTVALLRDQEPVEPPPWLTTRIMARIAEEAAPRRSLWQWFFQPWPVKVPLQALALVALCVTGYFLTRENLKQVDFSAPAGERIAPQQAPATVPEPAREATPAPAPVPPVQREQREQREPAPAPSGRPVPPAPAPPATVPTPPARMKSAPAAGSYAPPPPAAAPMAVPETRQAPLPAMKSLPTPTAERAYEVPAMAPQQLRDAAPAPAKAMRRPAGKEETAAQEAGVTAPPLILRFVAEDPATAGAEITLLAQRLGGIGRAITPRSHSVKLPAQRYQEFLVGMARLGELQVAQMAPTTSGQLQIYISW